MKQLLIRIAALLLLGAPVLVPVLVNAQSGSVNTSAEVNIPTSGSAGTGAGVSAATTAKMTRAKTKADTEIDRRVAALQDLLTRVQGMTKISADFKTNINTALQTQITGLTSLKAKIDADTDVDVLKTDVQSVTAAYRIFALVMPQVRIAAAADRQATIINMLSGIGVKLQARLQTLQGQGGDVVALTTALSDMAAKLADAQTHAQAAIDATVSLTSDNGDKTKMDANTAALKKAKTELQTAQQDLVAARKDISIIVDGMKKVKITTPTATSSTQTP